MQAFTCVHDSGNIISPPNCLDLLCSVWFWLWWCLILPAHTVVVVHGAQERRLWMSVCSVIIVWQLRKWQWQNINVFGTWAKERIQHSVIECKHLVKVVWVLLQSSSNISVILILESLNLKTSHNIWIIFTHRTQACKKIVRDLIIQKWWSERWREHYFQMLSNMTIRCVLSARHQLFRFS